MRALLFVYDPPREMAGAVRGRMGNTSRMGGWRGADAASGVRTLSNGPQAGWEILPGWGLARRGRSKRRPYISQWFPVRMV